MKMFKKKEKPSTSPALDALQELHKTEELLNKKQTYLETKIEKEMKFAKTNATKDKQAALQALKRKKKYEKQLQQLDGTLTTIEMQRQALEEANVNSAVVKTLKNAATALQNVHKDLNVTAVNNLIDDICDQRDLAEEIATAISMPVAFEDYDDDEIEKELEALEEDSVLDKMLEVPEKREMPTVPPKAGEVSSSRPKSGKKAEEADVKKSKLEIGRPKSSRRAEDDDDIKKLENWAS